MKKNIAFILIAAMIISCNRDRQTERPLLFLPDDLEASLWAESPMLHNPTNMDVDHKGRIWITEAVNYRNFRNDSTKALHHEMGDRVVILEDTDGDGRADASKVFVQDKDLTSPLGIAVIGNKVYVSCSPNLIVYTDTNGDDIPDKKEILLTGFGGLDHDHSLHAVVGGPDGNLYFNTGNAGPHIVTDKGGWTLRSGSVYTGGTPYNTSNEGNMKSDDGKVWVGGLALRMNPDGEKLKVLAHNFRNAYELAIDSRGDMWQNDNDDQVVACRTTWLMEGGNAGYFSADGTRTWQADQRPWQDIFSAHWHQDDPGVMPAGDNAGAGSPTGVAVNEGDALGSRYRGMVFSADAGRNVVFGYQPTRKGSGFDLGKRQNFITSLREDNVLYVWNDSAHNAQSEKWFRPSDVMIGTDGALYVADWYDPVVGGHQMQDTVGYGRIYRITPKDKDLVTPDLDLSSVAGQMEALRSPAVNVRYTALQRLVDAGTKIIPELKKMLDEENPYYQSRAIWALAALGQEGVAAAEQQLTKEDENLRLIAFRALRQTKQDIIPIARKLADDPSAAVRREVVIALADQPFQETKDLLLELASAYDGKDRWYLEALGATLGGNESEFYAMLMNKFNADNRSPDKWDDVLASLVWRLHPSESSDALKVRAASNALSDEERTKALTALSFIPTREAVQAMIALSQDKNSRVAEQAAYWVSFRQGNEWYALWDWKKTGLDLEHERKVAAMKIKRNRVLDPQMPPNEKLGGVRAMARDVVGAQMLLRMVAENELPAELYDFAEEQIRNNEDATVRMQAASYFREEDATTALGAEEILSLKGNAAAGKELFEKQCATCHRVGDNGRDIGPELTAIKSKFDRKTLLEAIINPDAGVVFGYEAWSISMKDGQSYFGFLLSDGERTITIRDLAGKNHVIEKSGISARKKQEKSLMPSPDALGLTAQNLSDISEYLLTLR